MSSRLDRIIEEARALPPSEQRQLRARLNLLAPNSSDEEAREDEFEREMVAEGFLGDVKPLPDDDPEFYNYTPVTVTGKPISETIIEERR